MFKPVKDTKYLGKTIHYFEECESTNKIASQYAGERSINHGDIVITDFQSKGKGQAGNLWVSEPGENLTLSIFVKYPQVKPEDQFSLNMAVSLAVSSFYTRFVGEGVKVKWPNDVLYSRRKLSGILIENSIKNGRIDYSILGLGLNINQTHFKIESATSLTVITGRRFNLQDLLSSLLLQVESYLDILALSRVDSLRKEYLKGLYGMNMELKFNDGAEFNGVIKNIDERGRLIIENQGVGRSYDFKEITFLI